MTVNTPSSVHTGCQQMHEKYIVLSKSTQLVNRVFSKARASRLRQVEMYMAASLSTPVLDNVNDSRRGVGVGVTSEVSS